MKSPQETQVDGLYNSSLNLTNPPRFATTCANLLTHQEKDLSNRLVYELLQNADDDDATIVEYYTSRNYLIIAHNGGGFNDKDVSAIADAASPNRPKRTNAAKIGYMGIGFKSVFGSSDYVLVLSRKTGFQFRFDKAHVVEKTAAVTEGTNERYPWEIIPIWTKNESIPPDLQANLAHIDQQQVIIACRISSLEHMQNIQTQLSQFCGNSRNILFLNKIDAINYFDLSTQKNLRSSINRQIANTALANTKAVTVTTTTGTLPAGPVVRKWYVNAVPCKLPPALQQTHEKFNDTMVIELAVEAQSTANAVVETSSNIYCYFQTNINTNISFVLNASFILDATRTHYRDGSAAIEWNKNIFSEAMIHHVHFIGNIIQLEREHWQYYLRKLAFPKRTSFEAPLNGPNFITVLDDQFKAAVAKTPLVMTLSNQLVLASSALHIDRFDFMSIHGSAAQQAQYIGSGPAAGIIDILQQLGVQQQSLAEFIGCMAQYIQQKLKPLDRNTKIQKYQEFLDYLRNVFARMYFNQNEVNQFKTSKLFLNCQDEFESGSVITYLASNVVWQQELFNKYRYSSILRSTTPENDTFLKNLLALKAFTAIDALSIAYQDHTHPEISDIMVVTTDTLLAFYANQPREWQRLLPTMRGYVLLQTVNAGLLSCQSHTVYYPNDAGFCAFFSKLNEIFGQENPVRDTRLNLAAYPKSKDLPGVRQMFIALGARDVNHLDVDTFNSLFNEINKLLTSLPMTENKRKQALAFCLMCFLQYATLFVYSPNVLADKLNAILTKSNNLVIFMQRLALEPAARLTDAHYSVLKHIQVMTCTNARVLADRCYLPNCYTPTHELEAYLLPAEVLSPTYRVDDQNQLQRLAGIFKAMGMLQCVSEKIIQGIISAHEHEREELRGKYINFVRYLFIHIYVKDTNDFAKRYERTLNRMAIWATDGRLHRSKDDFAYLPDCLDPHTKLEAFLPKYAYVSPEYYRDIQDTVLFGKFLLTFFCVFGNLYRENLPQITSVVNSESKENRVGFVVHIFNSYASWMIKDRPDFIRDLQGLKLLATDGNFYDASELYLSNGYEPDRALEGQNTRVKFLSDAYLQRSEKPELRPLWKPFLLKLGVSGSIQLSAVTVFAHDKLASVENDYIQKSTPPIKFPARLHRLDFIDQIIESDVFWEILIANWSVYKTDPNSSVKYYMQYYCQKKYGDVPANIMQETFNKLGNDYQLRYKLIKFPLALTEEQCAYFGFKISLTWDDCIQQLQALAERYANEDNTPYGTTEYLYHEILKLQPRPLEKPIKLLTHGAKGLQYQLANTCHALICTKQVELIDQQHILWMPASITQAKADVQLCTKLNVHVLQDADLKVLPDGPLEDTLKIKETLHKKLKFLFLVGRTMRGVGDPNIIRREWDACATQLEERINRLNIAAYRHLSFNYQQLKLPTCLDCQLESSTIVYVPGKINLSQYRKALYDFLNRQYLQFSLSSDVFENIWFLNEELIFEDSTLCNKQLFNTVYPGHIPATPLKPKAPATVELVTEGIAGLQVSEGQETTTLPAPVPAAATAPSTVAIGTAGEQYVFNLLKRKYSTSFAKIEVENDREFTVSTPKPTNVKDTSKSVIRKELRWVRDTWDMQVMTFFANKTEKLKKIEVKSSEANKYIATFTVNQVNDLLPLSTPNFTKYKYTIYFVSKVYDDVYCDKLKHPKLKVDNNTLVDFTCQKKRVGSDAPPKNITLALNSVTVSVSTVARNLDFQLEDADDKQTTATVVAKKPGSGM